MAARLNQWPFIEPAHFRGDDEVDTRLVSSTMLIQARDYLLAFPWCADIECQYVALAIGGVIAVFLFRIRPAQPGIDRHIWVVVGDLPSAYFAFPHLRNPVTVIDSYCAYMRDWCAGALRGELSADGYPVDVPPTVANAHALAGRLNLLDADFRPALVKQWQRALRRQRSFAGN